MEKKGLLWKNYILNAGPVKVNGYLLYDKGVKEAAFIDPGGETERILRDLERLGLKLKYILVTHGHFDHIGGVQKLQKATGAQICMSRLDSRFITDSEWNASNLVGTAPVPFFKVDHFFQDRELLWLGEYQIQILTTPGHTPGEVSVYIPGHLFCGDTILKGEIGRYDLPGADVSCSVESIRKKIYALPDDTVIHCGHREATTVGYEKENNRIVRL